MQIDRGYNDYGDFNCDEDSMQLLAFDDDNSCENQVSVVDEVMACFKNAASDELQIDSRIEKAFENFREFLSNKDMDEKLEWASFLLENESGIVDELLKDVHSSDKSNAIVNKVGFKIVSSIKEILGEKNLGTLIEFMVKINNTNQTEMEKTVSKFCFDEALNQINKTAGSFCGFMGALKALKGQPQEKSIAISMINRQLDLFLSGGSFDIRSFNKLLKDLNSVSYGIEFTAELGLEASGAFNDLVPYFESPELAVHYDEEEIEDELSDEEQMLVQFSRAKQIFEQIVVDLQEKQKSSKIVNSVFELNKLKADYDIIANKFGLDEMKIDVNCEDDNLIAQALSLEEQNKNLQADELFARRLGNMYYF